MFFCFWTRLCWGAFTSAIRCAQVKSDSTLKFWTCTGVKGRVSKQVFWRKKRTHARSKRYRILINRSVQYKQHTYKTIILSHSFLYVPIDCYSSPPVSNDFHDYIVGWGHARELFSPVVTLWHARYLQNRRLRLEVSTRVPLVRLTIPG